MQFFICFCPTTFNRHCTPIANRAHVQAVKTAVLTLRAVLVLYILLRRIGRNLEGNSKHQNYGIMLEFYGEEHTMFRKIFEQSI